MTSEEIELIKLHFEDKRLGLEREKVEIEKAKITVEEHKLKVERQKTRWAGIAIAIPLIALVISNILGFRTQRLQSESAFKLKVVEILMQPDSGDIAEVKAATLRRMFPNELPADFLNGQVNRAIATDIVAAEKVSGRQMLKLMVARPADRIQILEIWLAVYPDDRQAREILARLQAGSKPTDSGQRATVRHNGADASAPSEAGE